MDSAGRRLAKARLPEGVAGIARLHAMSGEQLGEDADEDDAGQVAIGIETDRGPWVAALIAAGYTVFAINPLQASRYRERHGVSGAKSDAGDAHVLADMVRTDSHQLRAVAGDTALAAAVKVVTRTHKTLIWERAQHPDAEILTSQPGLGPVLGARVLAESGDDPARYASAKARKNYAATSPITRASGKKKAVLARYVHNDRLIDALMTQAFSALRASPGARAYYHHQRARGAGHNPALRQL